MKEMAKNSIWNQKIPSKNWLGGLSQKNVSFFNFGHKYSSCVNNGTKLKKVGQNVLKLGKMFFILAL
jgi:hypothetical protein